MITKVDHLSEEARKAYVLAKFYERCRQETGQYGYQIFKDVEDLTANATFKTFCTVQQWMSAKQWSVGFRQVHWQGYVKFVFENFKPNAPQPGQLKNEVLLKKYMLSAPGEKPVEPVCDTESKYRKAIRSDLACLVPYFLKSSVS